jgi:hypothetical protein
MTISKQSFSAITSRPYWYLYIAGVVLLLGSGYLWWSKVYLAPERVFWGMMQTSLSTDGVTIETSQDSQQANIKQLVQVGFGSLDAAHSLTTLTQGNTVVKTEIIGTKTADYTRYRSIETDQKDAQGKPLDTSKVVGVWAKSDDTQQTSTQASGHQLFSQAVLGVGLPVGSVPVPIGDLTNSERNSLMEMIRSQNVYQPSFKSSDVKREVKNGHLLYTYNTKIQTILYVQLMKNFAKDLGMHELDQVDPNTYQTAQPLQVKLTVDARSRQLVGVDTGQGYEQTYEGYGLPLTVSIPKHPITTEDLQTRLSQL